MRYPFAEPSKCEDCAHLTPSARAWRSRQRVLPEERSNQPFRNGTLPAACRFSSDKRPSMVGRRQFAQQVPRLLSQTDWQHVVSGGAAPAFLICVTGNRRVGPQIADGAIQNSAQKLGFTEVFPDCRGIPLILLCQLDLFDHQVRHNGEQFPVMFDHLPSKSSQGCLARVGEVVTGVGVDGIRVPRLGLQFISLHFEVVRPRGLRWIQDFAACGRERAIRTSAITKSTRVEKVRIRVFLLRVLRLRNMVFNPGDATSFGTPSAHEVRFMQQAKRTGEPEVPAQSGAEFQVALASMDCQGTMSALNRLRRGFRLRRQDLHLGRKTRVSDSTGFAGFPGGPTNCRGNVAG